MCLWLGLAASMPVGGADTGLDSSRLVDAETIRLWHRKKDSLGATFAGSPAWRSHVLFVERQLAARGVVDLGKRSFRYRRWFVDDSKTRPYELIIGGERVPVAAAWAYSGSTDAQGVSAPLFRYRRGMPRDDLRGKLVVFEVTGVPEAMQAAFRAGNVYSTDTAPTVLPSLADDQWYQGNAVTRFGRFDDVLRGSEAAGAAVLFDMSPGRAQGLYTFPLLHEGVVGVPGLYFDRVAGARIRNAAQRGEQARLVLQAREEIAEAWFLHGILPGRNYGSVDDELVLLVTHSDGPNLTQENGTLGILGIVEYFSRVPREDRRRSLLVLLDPQHYMPGRHTIDWYAEHSGLVNRIVASIGVEQLGQRAYAEAGNDYGLDGSPEPTLVFAQDNQALISTAVEAIKAFDVPRAEVRVPSRGGQGVWAGLGDIAVKRSLPGFGISSTMTGYWSTGPGLESFDADLFRRQLGALIMMTAVLMDAERPELAVEEQDSETNPALAPGVRR